MRDHADDGRGAVVAVPDRVAVPAQGAFVSAAYAFSEFEDVSFIRDYAKGFFNTLISLPAPPLNHPEQYQRGKEHAQGQLRLWAPHEESPAEKYLIAWEIHALNDAATERRTSKSLSHALEAAQRRLGELERQLKHHSLRAHPTKRALKSMVFRTMGEARQLAKEQAERAKNPNPCVGCPAAVLCRDMAIACNQFFRYTTVPGTSQAKYNSPRVQRKPTESSTVEKMPPSHHWHKMAFA